MLKEVVDDNENENTNFISKMKRNFWSIKLKRSSMIYIIIIWFICPIIYYSLVILIGFSYRNKFSKPLNRDIEETRFSEERCLDLLRNLSMNIGSRVIFSKNNVIAYKWMKNEVEKISEKKREWVDVEISEQEFSIKNYSKVMESVPLYNLIVKISAKDGMVNQENAIMFSGHYDSVMPSKGASDDGHSIVVMMELMRNIITVDKQLLYPIIFIFNNGEESGLYGSEAFANHKWHKNVKRFVNLESMASGGRSLMFRNYPNGIARELKKCPKVFANVFSNDLMGLVSSDTDFSNYATVQKLPGFDFAFYEFGYFYHTKNDVMSKIKPGNIQQLGETLHQIVGVYVYDAKSPLLTGKTEDKNYMFFTLVNGKLIVYSELFHILLSIFLFICSLILVVFVVLVDYFKQSELKCLQFSSKKIIIIVLYIFFFILSYISGFIFCMISSFLASVYNRMAYFGSFGFTITTFGTATITGMIFSQWVCFKLFRKVFYKDEVSIHKYTEEKYFALVFLHSLISLIFAVFGIRIYVVLFNSLFNMIVFSFVFVLQNLLYILTKENKRKLSYTELKDNDDKGENQTDEVDHKRNWFWVLIFDHKVVYMIIPISFIYCDMMNFQFYYEVFVALAPMFGRFPIALPTVLFSIFICLMFFGFINYLPLLQRSGNYLKILFPLLCLSILFTIILSLREPYSKDTPKLIDVKGFYFSTDMINLTKSETIISEYGDLFAELKANDINSLKVKSKEFNLYKERFKQEPECGEDNICHLHMKGEDIPKLNHYDITKISDNQFFISFNFIETSYTYLEIIGNNYQVEWEESNKIVQSSNNYYKVNVLSSFWKGNFTLFESIEIALFINYCEYDNIPFIHEMFETNEKIILLSRHLEKCDYLQTKTYISLNI